MDRMQMIAPCLFGVEGIAADEFRRLGLQDVSVENGRVLFSGGPREVARANLCSRFAERIMICLGEFEAVTFDELFEGIKALPWEMFIGREDAFPVNGWSIASQLSSIPDCQSIIKKAIVERLKSCYGISWFNETGTEYKVRFSIHKNKVSAMIDTSGDGLHKRGYRRNANAAPLKETLAAAMCDTARIFPDTQFYDPFCGSGTLLIEAAMMASHMAPGLLRHFAAENFDAVPTKVWQEERTKALDEIRHGITFHAYGSDCDPEAVALTMQNAKKAGVDSLITVEQRDIRAFTPPSDRCVCITNPPYGERLLDVQQAEELYAVMGRRFTTGAGQKYFIISPHDAFETHFGRVADKRRKLYNGMIKCQLYMYYKQEK